MKRFKLIKEYPGCNCKLGDIVEKSNDYDRDNSHYKYPEYWEEVIEKDYEIMSFKQQGDYTFTKDDSGKFYRDKDINLYSFTEKQILNSVGVSIHSVKRLSDGEVFTVGDLVKNKIFKNNWNNCKIESFSIVYDKLEFNIIQNTLNSVHRASYNKNGWRNFYKTKQILFTTEDGVDIYEGDSFILLNTNTWYNLPDKGSKHHSSNYWSNSFKTFSTKEAAEEYILMNKPCLSINDIINSTCFKFQTVVDELKNKVKSKIK